MLCDIEAEPTASHPFGGYAKLLAHERGASSGRFARAKPPLLLCRERILVRTLVQITIAPERALLPDAPEFHAHQR